MLSLNFRGDLFPFLLYILIFMPVEPVHITVNGGWRAVDLGAVKSIIKVQRTELPAAVRRGPLNRLSGEKDI
jgi:hypothetical protein